MSSRSRDHAESRLVRIQRGLSVVEGLGPCQEGVAWSPYLHRVNAISDVRGDVAGVAVVKIGVSTCSADSCRRVEDVFLDLRDIAEGGRVEVLGPDRLVLSQSGRFVGPDPRSHDWIENRVQRYVGLGPGLRILGQSRS